MHYYSSLKNLTCFTWGFNPLRSLRALLLLLKWQSRSLLYSYVAWKFAVDLRAGSARTPGLPPLPPPCVTLVKSLNLLIKEE